MTNDGDSKTGWQPGMSPNVNSGVSWHGTGPEPTRLHWVRTGHQFLNLPAGADGKCSVCGASLMEPARTWPDEPEQGPQLAPAPPDAELPVELFDGYTNTEAARDRLARAVARRPIEPSAGVDPRNRRLRSDGD
jgi:hypothetical protein